MRRIAIIWFVLSAILTPIVVAVIAPTLPPGEATNAAAGQVFDDTVLFGIVTPIAVAIAVYFAYTMLVFRRRGEPAEEGVATRDNQAVHIPWLVGTTVIVLFLAAFGTVELTDAGAGGGEGPEPAFKLSGDVMPVQVIAQQWEFTYRYPTYGGVETRRSNSTSLRSTSSIRSGRPGSESRPTPIPASTTSPSSSRARKCRSTSAARRSAASGMATCSTPARW
jgi:cytochrome c oxidase subunit 2